MVSEPPPQVIRPTKPKPRPKRKIKRRPRPRPVVTEPVETKTIMAQPVAPPPPPSSAPRRATGRGTGSQTGPHVADFGSATGPAFLRRVIPVYPEQARRLGREGRVILRLTIDARGNLLKVEVLKAAGFGFDEAAVAAIKRSSFRPATVKGQAVASIARLPIRFVLRN